MKKLFKKLALMVVALLTFSVGSNYTVKEVKAADTKIVFNLGANGSATHADGSSKSTYSETVNGYTLNITKGTNIYTGARDAKGNSCIKMGASSKAGSFEITVPEDVTSVEIEAAKYKSNTTKFIVNGKTNTLTKNSNDGAYDVITVDTASNKTITASTASGGYRCMVNTITYIIADTGDSGEPEIPVEKTDEEKVNEAITNFSVFDKESKKEFFSKSKTITLDLEDKENETEISYTLTGDTDVFLYNQGVLTVSPVDSLKTATLTVTFTSGSFSKPITFTFNSWLENTILTLEEANIIGNLFDKDTYTEGKYYINCVIDEVYNTTYGNMYVHDENVDKFTIYGTYSADGEKRYDALTEKPIAGDSIKVYGVIGKYNDPQMKNGWIVEIVEDTPSLPELSIEEQIMANKTTTSLSFDYSIPDSQVSKISEVNELKIGDQIIISGTYVSNDGTTEYALSTNQKTNNRAAVELDTNSISSDVQIITLEAGTKENTYSFNTGSGYLYAASSSSNHLKTETEKSDNSSWSLEFTTNEQGETILNIIAQGSNTRNLLQFNPAVTDGVLNPLFACYAVDKPQKTVSIYKLTTPSNGTSSFDNISLLFGANVDSSLFENYTSVTAGVKISVGEKTADKSIVLTKDSNGNYNTSVGLVLELFADGVCVDDLTKERLKQTIEATVYFVVSDGNTTTTLELQSTLVSVESMVNTYITDSMYNTNETVLKHMAALKALKAYIEA